AIVIGRMVEPNQLCSAHGFRTTSFDQTRNQRPFRWSPASRRVSNARHRNHGAIGAMGALGWASGACGDPRRPPRYAHAAQFSVPSKGLLEVFNEIRTIESSPMYLCAAMS